MHRSFRRLRSQDRNFNRGRLSVRRGALPREDQRSGGHGPSATPPRRRGRPVRCRPVRWRGGEHGWGRRRRPDKDAIRPTSVSAIAELKALGVTTVLLSGDAKATAERVARDVGIDRVFAEVRPGQKAEHIKRLQTQGHVTAMVGDGVNP